MAEVSEQTDVDEGVAQTASFLAVVARALHVRDAQLQPTLDAIVSAAASALNEGRDAWPDPPGARDAGPAGHDRPRATGP